MAREVPTRLVVGFVKSQAYNGDFNLNPYHFQHFDVSDIGFFVNGESTPRPSFKLDVGNGTYLQGLNSLYKISGKTMENSDIGITRETYQQGYTLIGFDVDPMTSPDLIMLVKQEKVILNLKYDLKMVYLHLLLSFCMQPFQRL